SYNMPAFKQNEWIFYYSAYKNNYSLSCLPPFTVFEEFLEDLAPYDVSKGAINFLLTNRYRSGWSAIWPDSVPNIIWRMPNEKRNEKQACGSQHSGYSWCYWR